MELLSLTIPLRPLAPPRQDRPQPAWWGRAAHALCLRLIARHNPALAEQLHGESSLRPFTVSTLHGCQPNRPLDPARTYSLRLTALNQPVCQALTAALQPGGGLAPGERIDLDYFPFEVLPAPQPAEPPPARYADLAAAYLTARLSPPRRLAFEFISPTAFHSQERTLPYPLPELVFGSLLDKWNAFAPLAFPPEVRRYAAECLALSRFHLTSRVADFKEGGKRIGAVGQVTYTTLNYDRYWMSVLTALGAYAVYCGVGASASQGMGQCRLLRLQPAAD